MILLDIFDHIEYINHFEIYYPHRIDIEELVKMIYYRYRIIITFGDISALQNLINPLDTQLFTEFD